MSQRINALAANTGRWLSIFFFIAAIMLPLVGHIGGFFDESYIIKTEKRQPNPLPETSSIFINPKHFIIAFESYINDHFGFRAKLVSLNSLIRLKLGVSSSDKITVGKSGWLYYSAENIIEQYRGIENFSKEDLDSWIEAALSRKKWFTERGIPYLFAFFPEKTSAYPEYLPDWVTKKGPIRRDQVKDRLDKSKIDYVDVTSSVLEAKKEYPVYYKMDSHWNFHGGFAGYTAMMKLVQKYFPDIKPLTPQDINFGYKESKSQDLAQIMNLTGYLKDPNADYYVLKKPSKVLSSESINKNERLPLLVKTDIKDAPKVMIYRDSYTDLMEPYLNETFSQILYVQHGDQTFDEEFVDSFKPDIVITAMVERILRYPMHGVLPKNSPYILDWGPKEVFEGENFYVQPDGSSAMWVKSRGIDDSTTIEWEGVALKTDRNLKDGIVTASVPLSLYKKAGIFKIRLINKIDSKESDSFTIKVRQ